MAQNSLALLSPEVGCTFSTQTDLSTQAKIASEQSGNVSVGMMRTAEFAQE